MSHNRENLRLSLLDLQATLTAPSNTVAATLLPQTHGQQMTQPSLAAAAAASSSTSTLPSSSSSNSSSVSQAVSLATTTVARLSKAGFGGAGGVGVGVGTNSGASHHQNDKCDRLKKMTSITCSDSEDDSERRAQFEISCKWNLGGYDGVSLVWLQ